MQTISTSLWTKWSNLPGSSALSRASLRIPSCPYSVLDASTPGDASVSITIGILLARAIDSAVWYRSSAKLTVGIFSPSSFVPPLYGLSVMRVPRPVFLQVSNTSNSLPSRHTAVNDVPSPVTDSMMHVDDIFVNA